MTLVRKDIAELSGYLQTLSRPEFARKVEEAVETKDKSSLFEVCKSAKIPAKYFSAIVTALFSMSGDPDQVKYPALL
jgi:hypothetical protein